MIPGALVKNLCFTNLYSTVSKANKHLPDETIPFNSLMLIVSHPDGHWIKVEFNGKIGWVYLYYLEEI